MFRSEEEKAKRKPRADFLVVENCPRAGEIIDHIGLSGPELPEFMKMLQEVGRPRYGTPSEGYTVRNWWVQAHGKASSLLLCLCLSSWHSLYSRPHSL